MSRYLCDYYGQPSLLRCVLDRRGPGLSHACFSAVAAVSEPLYALLCVVCPRFPPSAPTVPARAECAPPTGA